MWFIRILLLIIIFLGGVYIGNVYMPQRDATTAVAVAVPPLETYGTDMSAYNFDAAQKTLADMYADMMQDPEHFSPTVSDARLKILNMTLALQNYNITRSKYEAEIAKNRVNAQPSPDYVKAAADYAAAKKTFEKYMQDQKAKEAALIPPPAPVTTPTQVSTPTASAQPQKSTPTVTAQPQASPEATTAVPQPQTVTVTPQPQSSSPTVSVAPPAPVAAQTQTSTPTATPDAAPAQK